MSHTAIRLTGHELGRLCRGGIPWETSEMLELRCRTNTALYEGAKKSQHMLRHPSVVYLQYKMRSCCPTPFWLRHGAKMIWGLAWSTYVSVKVTILFMLRPISQSSMKHHTLSNYAPAQEMRVKLNNGSAVCSRNRYYAIMRPSRDYLLAAYNISIEISS